MSNKQVHKIAALLSMTLMLAAFTHCVSESPSNKSSSSSSTNRNPSSNSETSNKPTGLAALNPSVGVKNHEQILHTMSALTGVPTTATNIMRTYNQVSTSMPTSNDIKSLGAANQMAIVQMAAEFCTHLIDRTQNTSRDTMFNVAPNAINFGNITLNNLSAPLSREAFIQRLVDNFWGGMVSESDLTDAENDLSDLFDDLALNLPNDNASARLVAKGVCTAALSSANVTLF